MNNTSGINSYTSWQPLEEVIVGRAYTPDYFEFIVNAQVRNQLQQILAETEEDLNNLQRTIETYGARVHRPDLPDREQFIRHQTSGSPELARPALPPLTPRDWQISLGQKLLRIIALPAMDRICSQYSDHIVNPHGAILNPATGRTTVWDPTVCSMVPMPVA